MTTGCSSAWPFIVISNGLVGVIGVFVVDVVSGVVGVVGFQASFIFKPTFLLVVSTVAIIVISLVLSQLLTTTVTSCSSVFDLFIHALSLNSAFAPSGRLSSKSLALIWSSHSGKLILFFTFTFLKGSSSAHSLGWSLKLSIYFHVFSSTLFNPANVVSQNFQSNFSVDLLYLFLSIKVFFNFSSFSSFISSSKLSKIYCCKSWTLDSIGFSIIFWIFSNNLLAFLSHSLSLYLPFSSKSGLRFFNWLPMVVQTVFTHSGAVSTLLPFS